MWRRRARATACAGTGEGRRERAHDTLDLIDLPLHIVDAGRGRAGHGGAKAAFAGRAGALIGALLRKQIRAKQGVTP